MSISNPSTGSEPSSGFVVPPHQEEIIGRLLNRAATEKRLDYTPDTFALRVVVYK